MKVINDESTKDRFGTYPIVFKGAKSFKEIYDWLWGNGYQGYRLCVDINLTFDEYCNPFEDGVKVHFADEMLEEYAFEYDFKLEKKRRTE